MHTYTHAYIDTDSVGASRSLHSNGTVMLGCSVYIPSLLLISTYIYGSHRCTFTHTYVHAYIRTDHTYLQIIHTYIHTDTCIHTYMQTYIHMMMMAVSRTSLLTATPHRPGNRAPDAMVTGPGLRKLERIPARRPQPWSIGWPYTYIPI
jgi:hypothetical protein